MLKLIDGTELTSEMKEAFKRRVTHAYIKLDDGTILSSSDHLKSVKLEDLRYNEETNNIIGEATSKRVTLGLFNKDNTLNLENKEFELVIGTKLVDGTNVEISYGKFIVQKPENNDTKQSTDFEAFDYMCKTNQKYVPGVTFPCTFGDLAEDVCNQCGLELGNKSFRNSEKLVYDNFFINDEQCRVVVKEIAKIAFSWARVSTDNKLYFDFNKKDLETVDELFTLDDYKELETNEETIPVNTIILSNSAVDSENITIYDDTLISQYGKTKELVVKEDYFAYSQEIRQELIEAGRELMGLVYSPITIKSIGTIYLESNDTIGIQDKQGNVLSSYCFNHIIDYNGVLYDSIESPAMTETQTEYKYESEEDLSRRRTEILVNKATQQVQILASKVDTYDSKIAQLEVDVEGVNVKVEEIVDITRVSTGNTRLDLENCMPGELLELHIYGNNTVFENGSTIQINLAGNIFPFNPEDWQNGYWNDDGKIHHSEPYNSAMLASPIIDVSQGNAFATSLPSEYERYFYVAFDKNGDVIESDGGILPEGAKWVAMTIVKKGFSIENSTYPAISPEDISNMEEAGTVMKNVLLIDLGVTEVLRQLDDIQDTYDLVNNKASVTRRVGVTEDGTLYELPEPIIEDLGELKIKLLKGLNTIKNSNPALMEVKYLINNDFTENFASTVELKSAIELLSNSINLQVSKKVGTDEIIARINMAVLGKEQAEIPEDINKSIIEILANKISIKSDSFELTKNGVITAKAGTIAGLTMSSTSAGSYLSKTFTDSNNETRESGLYIPNTSNSGNVAFLYAGSKGNNTANANMFIQHNGNMYFRSGCLAMIYEPTIGDNGSASWKNAMHFSSSGINRYLSNGNRWTYEGIVYRDSVESGHSLWLYDAKTYEIIDGVHNSKTLYRFYRADGGWYDGAATAEFDVDIRVWDTRWNDGVNNSIYIQGYEVATNASDERLKDNIKECTESALDILNEIPIITFDWKKDCHRKDAGDHIRFGYGAQRTQKIYDKAVIYNKDDDTYQMDVLNLSALQAKSIQELSKENKELKDKVSKLEERLAKLESMMGVDNNE